MKPLRALVALSWFAACSDNPGDPSSHIASLPDGVMVSNPVPAAALGGEARAALALSSGAGTDVVYVSLAPGTVPAGNQAIVRRVGDVGSLTTAVTDGGFDPVPVVAQSGDSIEVRVTDAGGGTVYIVRAAVMAARPPVIVRTEPPPRKRDVLLNASMVIVFSEPVNGHTVNSASVQLFRGSSPIAGTVSLLSGTATSAVFAPAAPLDPNADYRLTVTQDVRDLQGESLAAADNVDFTTGSTTVGAIASVSLGLNDTATVVPLGSQFQLSATAMDAQGNAVVGRPVAWSSTNSSVVTVSATGLATASAEGSATVVATVDGQSGRAPFVVTATLAPVGTVTVTPESATISIGGMQQLHAEIRDADGQLATHRLVTWSSTNPTVATVTGTEASAVVTGVTEGTTRIAATVEGKSDTAIITVKTPGPIGPIAFTSGRDGCSNIYSMNSDGSSAAALTDCSGGGGRSAAWSPDGHRLAFTSNGHVYVMSADGSQRQEIRPADTTLQSLGQPAWSPDGMKLAAIGAFIDGYSCGRTSCTPIISVRLVVMNADGTSPYYGPGRSRFGPGEPAWSLGGRIAYTWLTSRSPFQRDIYVWNPDGTSTNLTNVPPTNDGPAWSPDGTRIAFRSDRSGVSDLYVMNANGSGVTQLTADSAAEGRPAWSPDGTMIAFASTRDGNWEIYVMNADGSGVSRLTNNDWFDGEPAWRR